MILVIAPQKAEQNLRLHVMKDQQLIFNTNMGNLENVLNMPRAPPALKLEQLKGT